MEQKKWYLSKIVWVAFAAFLLSIAAAFGYEAPEGTAEQIVDQDWTAPVAAILNVAIIVARIFFTNKTLH